MFDISIGTIVPIGFAEELIPQLNTQGFECYELSFNRADPASLDLEGIAGKLLPLLEGRKISCLGYYGNPIAKPEDREHLSALIRSAKYFQCDILGAFAGGDPDKSVPEVMPQFRQVWGSLASRAEDAGVKIGFEGCGSKWEKNGYNISYCPAAWELMFDAVPSEALGLEWEPCHAMMQLADPIAQLRHWAHKVVHVHGKDGTVAWDVIREHGIYSPHRYAWNRTPGFGDTNWADVFTILLQAGFEGACDIEGYHDPVHYDDMEWTAQVQALKYLKACRGGETYWPGPTAYRGYQKKQKK